MSSDGSGHALHLGKKTRNKEEERFSSPKKDGDGVKIKGRRGYV